MNSLQYRRINIVGAPGSGCTSLGQALSLRLGIHFVDADSFYWKPTDPPFTEKYDADVRLNTLVSEAAAFEASVVAGSVCGWGLELEDSFDLAVFLSLPTELRLQRIEAREISLFGGANPAFLAWAAQYDEGKLPGRSRARHEAWLESRRCAVLRLEGDETIEDRVEQVIKFSRSTRR